MTEENTTALLALTVVEQLTALIPAISRIIATIDDDDFDSSSYEKEVANTVTALLTAFARWK